jgi:hypothetical protein
MEIVIIENLYPKLGIVNGYIQNIIVTKSQWIQQGHSMHFPINDFVDLNELIKNHESLQDITQQGQHKNVIPIVPM